MQNKNIFKIFIFVSCFFTFYLSSSAIVITSLGDRFDCLPYEIITDIFNEALKSSLHKNNFPKKNYKFIKKETLQVEECLVLLDTLSILSRSFYALTKEYKNTALKKTLTIYEITQKKPSLNSLIIAKKIGNTDYYDFHKEVFNAIQWFSFYLKLLKSLKKYQHTKSLIHVSKNVLSYTLSCMNEQIIDALNKNIRKKHPLELDPHFNYDSVTTLDTLNIPTPKWFSSYLKNPVELIPKIDPENGTPYVDYTKCIEETHEDREKINNFLAKVRNNFLQYSEVTDLIKILTCKPLIKKWVPIRSAWARPTFLIMQFLILLYEGHSDNKNKEMCLLLQRLSNYYWNKTL